MDEREPEPHFMQSMKGWLVGLAGLLMAAAGVKAAYQTLVGRDTAVEDAAVGDNAAAAGVGDVAVANDAAANDANDVTANGEVAIAGDEGTAAGGGATTANAVPLL